MLYILYQTKGPTVQSYQAPNRLWVSLGAIVLLALIIASGAYLGTSNTEAAKNGASKSASEDARTNSAFESEVASPATVLTPTNTAPDISSSLRFSLTQKDSDFPQHLLDDPYVSWENNNKANINLGYQKGAVWVRLDFRTAQGIPPHWIMEQANPLVDQMDLYLYQQDALVKHWLAAEPVGQPS